MGDLLKEAKNTLKLGVLTGVGQYGIGQIANIDGMPQQAKTTAGVVNTGLGLVNVGQLAKVGMSIIPKTPKLKSKTGNILDKIY